MAFNKIKVFGSQFKTDVLFKRELYVLTKKKCCKKCQGSFKMKENEQRKTVQLSSAFPS